MTTKMFSRNLNSSITYSIPASIAIIVQLMRLVMASFAAPHDKLSDTNSSVPQKKDVTTFLVARQFYIEFLRQAYKVLGMPV